MGRTDQITEDRAINDILADWRRRLRSRPDLRPRQGGRGQRERSLTRALLEAASTRQRSTSEDIEALGKLAMIAALYGAERPREQLDPNALCEELAHLRQAVWQHLKRQQLNGDDATQRILAFDRALSVALRAAITGGHRCSDETDVRQMLPPIVTDTVPALRETRNDR